jgi:hypothetical protein
LIGCKLLCALAEVNRLKDAIIDQDALLKLTHLPPAVEGYGNLKGKISTVSHKPGLEILRNRISTNALIRRRINSLSNAAAAGYFWRRGKEEKRSILFVLTLRGLKQDEDNYVFQEDLSAGWRDCRIGATGNR